MKKYIGVLALLLNLGGFALMSCSYAEENTNERNCAYNEQGQEVCPDSYNW